MEKIDLLGGAYSFKQTDPKKRKVEKKTASHTSFSRLVEAEENAHHAEVEDLPVLEGDISLEHVLDEIHSLGEQVKENPTLAVVKEYKKAVGAFLKAVIRQGIAVEEKVSGVNILKRKKFYLIEIIDQKLERLAAGVLQNQRDQLEILRRVDEIHGLLIDLLQ